jgi:hypothetical protein
MQGRECVRRPEREGDGLAGGAVEGFGTAKALAGDGLAIVLRGEDGGDGVGRIEDLVGDAIDVVHRHGLVGFGDVVG